MNPYMIQRLAAARVRDLQRQAVVSERLRLARRARRGGTTAHRRGI
jgi:hypothetical protein